MDFFSFQKQMQRYPLFTIHDLALIFPKENRYTLRKQISIWMQNGKLVKIKNGLYLLSEDLLREPVSQEVIAAKLYSPSYISLEYALSFYGIIPEAVFEFTSITTKPTRVFKTPFGIFRYHTVKTSCFFGFTLRKHGAWPFYMAESEKALLDFLYLNNYRLKANFQTWKDLRFQNLPILGFKKLLSYAKKFHSKKLILLIQNLKQYATSN